MYGFRSLDRAAKQVVVGAMLAYAATVLAMILFAA